MQQLLPIAWSLKASCSPDVSVGLSRPLPGIHPSYLQTMLSKNPAQWALGIWKNFFSEQKLTSISAAPVNKHRLVFQMWINIHPCGKKQVHSSRIRTFGADLTSDLHVEAGGWKEQDYNTIPFLFYRQHLKSCGKYHQTPYIRSY